MIYRSALIEQMALYVGWTYGAPAHYPTKLPGVKLGIAPPTRTDCCSFVEGLVVGGAVRAGLAVEWGLEFHRRAMVMDSIADRFGPCDALCDAGLAWPVAIDSAPPAWSVCQGWNGGKGHTFIVADSGPGDRVLVLEANNAHGLNGPGWRSLGPLGSANEGNDGLPVDWHQDERAWTWGRVREAYNELVACSLRVGDA